MEAKKLNVVRVKLVDEPPLFSDETINSPEAAVRLIQRELRDCDREVFCALHLNAKGKPLSMSIISVGELTSTLVHPREVFKASILSNASGIIFMHNHPSGDMTPSNDDINTTKRLEEAGNILGIKVVDHIIVGESQKNYYSLRAKDILSPEEEKKKQQQKKKAAKKKEQEAR